MMKKRICVLALLCGIVALCLTSCGGKMKNTASWAEKSVFYQVFVRSFYDSNNDGIGDFNGVCEKLDYIKDLGANAIWLMPINKCETYHGYDMVDYYNVQSEYGTMEDLENLVKECHKRDMKIIMDLVINHTSYHHPWFLEAMNDKDSPCHDRYIFVTDKDKEFNVRKAVNGERFYAVFSDHMPDLNYRNETVQEEMLKVADFYLDKGMDGFRLDAAKFIDEDMSITHDWWKKFTKHVQKKNPQAFIVGENWITKLDEISEFYGDMNSSFNFNLCDTIQRMAQGQIVDIASRVNSMREKYIEVANSEGSANNYPIDSTMINNHDMDRIASVLRGNKERTKMAATMLYTLPGTPFIYYGEELGQLGRSPDPNRREPFDWYASMDGDGMTKMNRRDFTNMTYTKANDGISLEEEINDSNSIYNHYKKLIKIRRDNDFLFTGVCENINCKDFGMYRYKTYNEDKSEFIETVLNLGKKTFKITLDYSCVDLLTGNEYKSGDEVSMNKETQMILKAL